MCGIAGMFGTGNPELLDRMLSKITHRGPDDKYSASGSDFALGARRLSIVDLDGGRQPLANEDRCIWAAQNGELYNFPEIRPVLQKRGHIFRSNCDTEILPHLYEDCGVDFVREIDGMFAVAIWDDSTRTGVLARDRMGKKPLYYCIHHGHLYFASEIKSLLCIPGLPTDIDFTALHHYLSLKHVPHPWTIFKDIAILPPAHRLVFRSGRPPEIDRYWKLDFAPVSNGYTDEDELTDEFISLLRKGIKRRLMADVPLGFFLSGGIDSSLSTALAAEMSGRPIKTFTLTYGTGSSTEGKDLDRYWARRVARQYGTEHYEERIQFEHFPESIQEIISFFDEPFAGVTSTYYLSRLIRRHVKVAVSGDGADELFGSYLSHRLAFPMAQLRQFEQTGNAGLIEPFSDQPGFLRDLWTEEDGLWRARLFVLSEEEKLSLYNPELSGQITGSSTEDYLRRRWAQLTSKDPLNRVLEFEFGSQLPDQVLTFVDRLSMAHSLEVRTAFLDTDVVTFVAGLPGRLKIRGGKTKYLLKKAARRFFPEEMVDRPKEGFLMPVTNWILDDLQEYVRDTLSPGNLKKHGVFHIPRVQSMIDTLYESDNPDYRQVNKVFALLIFQVWYDIYFGN